MPFHHDSRGIDPENTLPTLPDGWYTLRITDADEMTSKKGYDMILAKCSPVGAPEYADASIWHYVVFMPKDQKGSGMSVLFRKAIGVAYGGDDIVDAEEWIGRKFSAYVLTETYEGKRRNKINMVKSLVEEAAQKNGIEEEVPF